MTRLAAGGRAAQPGLLCRWHFWRRACANRKARIQAAAEKVWLEHVGRAVALANASDSVVLLSVPETSGKALSGQQGAL